MPKVMLTDRALPTLPPGTYFDTHVRGLVLRVGARARQWSFVYRNGAGPEWYRLGEYDAVSLKEARDLVKEHRRNLDKFGIDPAADKRKPPVEPEPIPEPPKAYTFADFVPTFVAFQKGRNVKSWNDDEQKIERHLLPVWRDRPLTSIERDDVTALLDGLIEKGLTVGVNRIQALISRIFTVALDKGKVKAHPATRIIKRAAETPRDRVLSDAEIRALWAGLDARPGAASDAIKLRLLLGQRGGETAGMKWIEVDLDAAEWTLPLKRTKTRQRAHRVPLPPTAHALLTRRREIVPDDDPRVFPDLSLLGDEHKDLAAIHGGQYEWKDLRRTLATRLGDLGFGEDVIGRVLNHARYSVTAKHYNHASYFEPMRDALTAWDIELNRILRGEPNARVLNMRARLHTITK